MAGDEKARKDALDSLAGWMENLDGASLEDLRAIRRDLGHDVEGSERSFLEMLREKSQESGIELKTSAVLTPDSDDETGAAEPLPKKRLLTIAKEQGFPNAQRLADAVELSVVLVKMLDRGLIEITSIPPAVIVSIASAVKHPVETLQQCLQIPPRLMPGMQYKADVAPEIEEPQDFFEAVVTDPTLSEERCRRLLSLKSK